MREQIKTDYTEDEISNLKNGKCWCGKPSSEFDKGMRVYCTKAHRLDWYARTVPWSIFKDNFLEKVGKKCVKCGCTPKSLKKRSGKDFMNWLEEIKNNPIAMKIIEETRINELNDLEKNYQEIMNDDFLIRQEFERHYSDLPDGVPKAPKSDDWIESRFEVDHILAVSLGGEIWDEKNLQVLCYKDHKEKTSLDMKKLKARSVA